MFNFFKRKNEVPKQLVFKSNAGAFEYACRFLMTDLTNGDPVTAIVRETKEGRDCVVKVANKEDPSIPEESVSELISENSLKFICPMAKPLALPCFWTILCALAKASSICAWESISFAFVPNNNLGNETSTAKILLPFRWTLKPDFLSIRRIPHPATSDSNSWS
jgi:hypothetical protein